MKRNELLWENFWNRTSNVCASLLRYSCFVYFCFIVTCIEAFLLKKSRVDKHVPENNLESPDLKNLSFLSNHNKSHFSFIFISDPEKFADLKNFSVSGKKTDFPET